MDTILQEIFYDPKIGLMSFEKFRRKVKELHPEIKTNTIKSFYENQEINQMSKKPTINQTTNYYKINGPELSFQIDLMFVPKAIKTKEAQAKKAKEEGLFPKNLFYVFLLCVDILSRKAYIYGLPNKQLDSIMEGYRTFIKDVEQDVETVAGTDNYFEQNKPYAIVTDDGFDFKEFMDYNKDNNIMVDASTAYDDHITNGNRLGIIDRLVRTIKNLLNKFVYATSGKTYSIKQVVKDIVDNYNNTPHSSLDNTKPNEVFYNKEARMKIFNDNLQHNESIETTINLAVGDRVRIYNKKDSFSKEKPQFSKELYTISEQTGYKYYVVDSNDKKLSRRFKPTELLKVNEDAIQNKNVENIDKEITSNKKAVKRQQTLKQLDIQPNNILPDTEKRTRKPNLKYI